MRYFLGFLAAIGLIVLVFILVLRGLSGGGSRQSTVQTLLTDYAKTETVMRMTVDGTVNADQSHRRARITVGRDMTTVETLEGYQEQVIDTQTYVNNEESYYTFLRALQLQGYTKGVENKALTDERGYCPTGKRYIFEIVTGNATVQRYWKGSCGPGTFKGNSSTIRLLFQKQAPDYSKMTRGLGLN